MRLRTELYFCRTHFDSYFLYSTNLLTLLYYTIVYYTTLHYTILHYSWDKRSCHACWKLMLESNIKQFYHPRSEDSAVNAYDISRRLLWISCCWFCIYFKRLLFRNTLRWLLLQREKDIFNNHNVYDNKRCLQDSKKST